MAIGVGYPYEKEPTLLCPECGKDDFIPEDAFVNIADAGQKIINTICKHCGKIIVVKGINKVSFISAQRWV